MKNNKTALVFKILILVIVILLGIIVYAFVIRPQITSYAVKVYNQGYENAILQVVQEIVTCKPVPLRVGDETINIIAVECLNLPKG